MVINWWQFFMQCLAMTAWVFIVAAVYAIGEKFVRSRMVDQAQNEKSKSAGR